MLVKEVMTTEMITAKPYDQTRSVAAAICTRKISGVPVVDDEGRLVGLVSEKDILNCLLPSYSDFLADPVRCKDFESMELAYHDVLTRDVSELMTSRLYTVGPEDPIMLAASRMALHGFRRIPVVDPENRLIGIVSLGDVHKAIFQRELGMPQNEA
ncbi:CBS domain-containing protein [Magnetofaba australis]|uniref:Putative signal-transduction protein n=1 Tax=Magnetofaba australis IT-1 TaxID=1434232 RepID=A0A1Y2K2R2_9PROT|nr:CBS domain-containing protein [Magnetofaba australis]OSM02331.1 putative signal-transduction protein [Magnetofaba australis IT-1]